MKFTITEHSTEGELLDTKTREFNTVEDLVGYIEKRKRKRDKVDITTIQNVGWLQVTRKYYPF